MNSILYGSAIVLCGIVAAFVLHEVFRWLQKKADLTESRLDDIVLYSLDKPLCIAIILGSVWLAVTLFVDLEALLGEYAWLFSGQYFTAVAILIAAWAISSFAYSFVNLYGRWMASKTETDLDDRIIRVFEVSARYVVWFVAILMVLQTLEVNITPLIAGAGIAGLAVALAAQDIISNFFGGAVILMDRPFAVNDRIKIDTYLGDVISIGPRSTRIKTMDYQMVTIPNSKVASSVIVNYAMPDVKLKIKVPISVAYGSDVKRVKEILLEIADEAAARSKYVLSDPAPTVYFLEFGASSMDFMLVIWAQAFNMAWDVQDYVNTRVCERFTEEGIEIPFPQMDVHMRD
ncbi:mechanosensitive ion channel family protein [Methanoculleus oceani]|uniref:Mechanosensitive ion channel protein MscS n=1 Tax=Methanoculleus oceani TaxID=2184756 RepID=A0ABD4TE91_9EURY|nr:mechanosensitive ion channel family protein [Methanoculleus sp. CWC-02]MCM2466625.1 mechanosensitive ion channel protein MscS [Methanoculleus sp. CWC-02]